MLKLYFIQICWLHSPMYALFLTYTCTFRIIRSLFMLDKELKDKKFVHEAEKCNPTYFKEYSIVLSKFLC